MKIIEIPDECEKSPELENKEVDSTAEREEKNTGNGDGGKEKEADDSCKEKEEKDRTLESDKDTPAEVKPEGSEGKNSEAEVGKDEKMDTSSSTEEKKGTLRCKTKHLFKLMLKYRCMKCPLSTFDPQQSLNPLAECLFRSVRKKKTPVSS